MPAVNSEKLLTISEAAKRFPPAGVSLPTVWRWVLRGTRGRRLESVLIGGRRYVPAEAIERFMRAEGTAAAQATTTPGREKQILVAEKQLAEMGL